MEHNIPFGNSNRENGPTFLDFPLFLGIFQWDEPTKRVPFTAEPEIPEILTKWKAPYDFYMMTARWEKIYSSNSLGGVAGQHGTCFSFELLVCRKKKLGVSKPRKKTFLNR